MTADHTQALRWSPRQRRLWHLEQEATRSAYRVACFLEVAGTLDTERLARAFRTVIAKHEILRTTIHHPSASTAPALAVASDAAFEIDVGDSPDRWDEGPFAEVPLARAAVATALDLTQGPLLRVRCLRVGENKHRLLIVAHAFCLDPHSLELLITQVFRAYGATGGARSVDVPEFETAPYAEVADWHRELLESADAAPGLAFWRRRRPHFPPIPDLPGAVDHEPAASFDPRWIRRCLDRDTTMQLQAFAGQCAVAPRDILLAAWVVLLRRLTGQAELTVGVGVDGRRLAELRGVVGPLKSYLPLRVHVSDTDGFMRIVEHVGQERRDIEQWQECFEWPRPDVTSLPYSFDYQGHRSLRGVAPDLDLTIVEMIDCDDRFPCRLTCVDLGDTLTTALCYDESAVRASAAERLAGQYHTVLASALAHPRARIATLAILSKQEREQLLVELNDTATDAPRDTLAHQPIEEYARLHPDTVALACDGQTLTYGEIDARANQLAHYLQGQGVGPDSLVALCLPRSVDLIISVLATLKAGGAYVPVDPSYPKDRIVFLLEDTSAAVVVTLEQLARSLPSTRGHIVCIDTEQPAIHRQPRSRSPQPATPQNLAYVIYTSGSTGTPKGVAITHEKLVISNSARVSVFDQVPERFLLLSSVAFDSSVVGIFWTLCGGGTLVLVSEDVQQNLPLLAKTIATYQITHLLTLPSFYRLLLQHASSEQLATVRTVIVAGEACPKKIVDRHHALVPHAGLFSEYGATETTVFSSVYDCRALARSIAPLGKPIDNAEMYILDEHLQPTPIGVAGEVYFGGRVLALGYLNRPALTAERFVPHPFSQRPGERLYRSGDLARHHEGGDIEFLGRLDNQIKIRGYRVELEEIEIVLAGHAMIDEAVVVAQPVGEEKRLVGYLVSTAAGHPSIRELRDFVKATLPDYMVPAVFVFLDELPRTPNGKVDRDALPEPPAERPELESEFTPPRNKTERILSGIFSQVLGLDRVGIHDNFFELGGDSILAIQIVSRAREAGVGLTARQMFEYQSVAQLASAASESGARESHVEQTPVVGRVPLTPVQHWFFEQDVRAPHHWNMPMVLDVLRPLDVDTLSRAMCALMVHHDALRLRFRGGKSEWEQEITEPTEDVSVSSVDLTGLPDETQDQVLAAKASQIQTSLDLSRGPLIHAALFERGSDRPQVLLLVAHHLVVDGVSWRILLEDLEQAVDQLVTGEAPRCPPKTTSFKEWAEALQAIAASPELTAEASRWIDPGRSVPLPVDHPGGSNLEGTVDRVTVELSETETGQLLTQVPTAGDTRITDVLIAALVRSVAVWTGHSSLLLNLEGHGRENIVDGIDLSRTVGWFTTDYPVRFTFPVPFEPGTAIEATKEQLRRIPNNGIGFGILRYLGSAAGHQLRALRAPEIAFNYLGQFDRLFAPGSRFCHSRQSPGRSFDPQGRRAFLIEVYGAVYDARLEVHWEYSTALHRRATIERVARDFLETLRTLIAHCVSTDADGLRPSDFAVFGWDQTDLAGIVEAIEKVRD